MVVNPDPKPGRWILPLVVLGMVAFTYFFVRELPADGPDVIPNEPGTSDTTAPGGPPDNGTTPGTGETVPPTSPPPNGGAGDSPYFQGADAAVAGIVGLQTEMGTVNSGFDADPRTIEYEDAEARLEALAGQAEELVAQVNQLEPPPAITTNHEAVVTAVTGAAAAADDALAGLRSDDDGSQRRDAVAAFDQAVADLQQAVDNARAAADGEPPADDGGGGGGGGGEGGGEDDEGGEAGDA